jgi:predicted GNAT family N-acyltransferase
MKTMNVELFGIDDEQRMRAASVVRLTVFVEEQRIPSDEEFDEHDRDDAHAVHALARDADGRVLGTGRYYCATPGTAQIGRLAVHAGARGRGAGRVLLDALVADARRRGYVRAVLNAQDHAIGFYAKAGFVPFGETVVECAIVHQPMARELI